ncbi:MAG: histone deacetylase [Verrucomicrobiales bacterium]
MPRAIRSSPPGPPLRKRLHRQRIGEEGTLLEPRSATRDEVVRCHSGRYYDLAQKEVAEGAKLLSTGDTNVGDESFSVALLAAGAALLAATEAIFSKQVSNAFVASRPPGHHATPSRGMGFCLFNNAAIAARHAQQKFGVERVAIFDWDVHHGNGTQDIFYQDGSVLFCSTHQHPWYPGTGMRNESGEGKGKGTTINVPLPGFYIGYDLIGEAFREAFIKKALAFKPDFVIISFTSTPASAIRSATSASPTRTSPSSPNGSKTSRPAPPTTGCSVLEGGYHIEVASSR